MAASHSSQGAKQSKGGTTSAITIILYAYNHYVCHLQYSFNELHELFWTLL